MNPLELNASVTAIVNVFAAKLSAKELEYWGILLTQLGAGMSAVAALRELQCGEEPETREIP